MAWNTVASMQGASEMGTISVSCICSVTEIASSSTPRADPRSGATKRTRTQVVSEKRIQLKRKEIVENV